MKIVTGNYSWPRVGHVETLKAGLPGRPFFVGGPEYVATEADAKRWGFEEGKAYRDWTWPGYPLVIEEDTEFRGANLSQESPHTDGVFQIVPQGLVNPVLRFVVDEDGTHCNLVNVKVPDGAYIEGGNLAHLILTETGNKDRPTVNLLHECDLCATAHKELVEGIEAGDLPKSESGAILHHEMKERYAARRDFADLVAADLADVVAGNDAALAKFPGGK